MSLHCHYAECHYGECHYAECHYAECHYTECRYNDCHYAECHDAECRCAGQGGQVRSRLERPQQDSCQIRVNYNQEGEGETFLSMTNISKLFYNRNLRILVIS